MGKILKRTISLTPISMTIFAVIFGIILPYISIKTGAYDRFSISYYSIWVTHRAALEAYDWSIRFVLLAIAMGTCLLWNKIGGEKKKCSLGVVLLICGEAFSIFGPWYYNKTDSFGLAKWELATLKEYLIRESIIDVSKCLILVGAIILLMNLISLLKDIGDGKMRGLDVAIVSGFGVLGSAFAFFIQSQSVELLELVLIVAVVAVVLIIGAVWVTHSAKPFAPIDKNQIKISVHGLLVGCMAILCLTYIMLFSRFYVKARIADVDWEASYFFFIVSLFISSIVVGICAEKSKKKRPTSLLMIGCACLLLGSILMSLIKDNYFIIFLSVISYGVAYAFILVGLFSEVYNILPIKAGSFAIIAISGISYLLLIVLWSSLNTLANLFGGHFTVFFLLALLIVITTYLLWMHDKQSIR